VLAYFSCFYASTKRVSSTVNIVKTRHCNKIEVNFLTDFLILCIERKIATKFSTNSIVGDFRDLKKLRVSFL
jgi:hypothetical protein